MIKVIVFDFDLTLVDSFRALHRAWRDFEKFHHVSFFKIPEKKIWGMPKELVFKKIAQQSGHKLDWQQIRDLGIGYTKKHFAHLKIRAKAMLKEFKRKKIKIGIVSYNFYSTVSAVLKNPANRNIKFDFIFTSDKNSKKKKHQFLNHILKLYKIKKNELIYIGDHSQDIEAAKKAGVISAAVATGLFSMEQLKKCKPDILISKLIELKKYVQ